MHAGGIEDIVAQEDTALLTVGKEVNCVDVLAAFKGGGNLFNAILVGRQHDDFSRRVNAGKQFGDILDAGIYEGDFVAVRCCGDVIGSRG